MVRELKIEVKKVPVMSWMNARGREVVEAFNRQRKHLYLEMFATNIDSLAYLGEELYQGMFKVIYPNCKEAEALKELVEDSENIARFITFSVADLEVEETCRIRHRLSSDLTRAMCIKHQYYTRGDCEAYDKLLSVIYNHDSYIISGDRLYDVAKDIKDHSDTEDSALDIANNLFREAVSTVIETYLDC